MTYSNNVVAPSIYVYENTLSFHDDIIKISELDTRKWIINNQEAVDWQSGSKILGYDEYPINFTLAGDEKFLILGKRIWDCVVDYSTKNLTSFDSFDSCIIRKYSSDPAFLELESSDVDNPSRKITSISFLNDVESGGEIRFNNFNVSVSPKAATTLVFPSSFAYSFKINKPKNDHSFIVVSHFV